MSDKMMIDGAPEEQPDADLETGEIVSDNEPQEEPDLKEPEEDQGEEDGDVVAIEPTSEPENKESVEERIARLEKRNRDKDSYITKLEKQRNEAAQQAQNYGQIATHVLKGQYGANLPQGPTPQYPPQEPYQQQQQAQRQQQQAYYDDLDPSDPNYADKILARIEQEQTGQPVQQPVQQPVHQPQQQQFTPQHISQIVGREMQLNMLRQNAATTINSFFQKYPDLVEPDRKARLVETIETSFGIRGGVLNDEALIRCQGDPTRILEDARLLAFKDEIIVNAKTKQKPKAKPPVMTGKSGSAGTLQKPNAAPSEYKGSDAIAALGKNLLAKYGT